MWRASEILGAAVVLLAGCLSPPLEFGIEVLPGETLRVTEALVVESSLLIHENATLLLEGGTLEVGEAIVVAGVLVAQEGTIKLTGHERSSVRVTGTLRANATRAVDVNSVIADRGRIFWNSSALDTRYLAAGRNGTLAMTSVAFDTTALASVSAAEGARVDLTNSSVGEASLNSRDETALIRLINSTTPTIPGQVWRFIGPGDVHIGWHVRVFVVSGLGTPVPDVPVGAYSAIQPTVVQSSGRTDANGQALLEVVSYVVTGSNTSTRTPHLIMAQSNPAMAATAVVVGESEATLVAPGAAGGGSRRATRAVAGVRCYRRPEGRRSTMQMSRLGPCRANGRLERFVSG